MVIADAASTSPKATGTIKPFLVTAVLAAISFALLWYNPSWSFGTPVYVVFYTTAILMLLFTLVFADSSQRAFDAVAAFSHRRGAFRSDVIAERPKFALIRAVFGAFMIERAVWLIVYLYPADWSDPVVVTVVFGNLLAAALVLAGLFTQVALVYLVLFQWQFGDIIIGTSTLGNDIAAMLAIVLMFANAGAHYSLDALLMRRRGLLGAAARTFYFDHGMPSTSVVQNAKLIAIACYWFVCIYSLMMHLSESAWMTGVAGPHLLTNNFMSRYAAEFEWLFQLNEWAVLIGRFALWAMLPWYALVLPLLFAGRLARFYVIGWGLLFFALSAFVLQLGWLAQFEFLLFAALFWEKSFIQNPGSLQVAYDDRCNLCDRTVTTIKWLDIFRRVELRPVSKNVQWLKDHGISEDVAMTDLYGIEARNGNRKSAGYDFYITLTRNVFLLLPAYPILLIGKVTGIGPRIYRMIADRRVKLFGVCQIPTAKPTHAPVIATVPDSPGTVSPAIAGHVLLLGIMYLVSIPAPFAGWQGVPLPPALKSVTTSGATAAHLYGITPIDVFNRTDLRMAEHWFTLSVENGSGNEVLLPIFTEKGYRLGMHASDRVYFGNTLQMRRAMIGGEGCRFEDFRGQISRLAEYHLPSARGGSFVYRQFLQPLADDSRLLSGAFVPSKTELVCTERFKIE